MIGASVWITWSIVLPLGDVTARCRALTMPAVTVRSSPNGLPIATTGSPTLTASESARASGAERLRGQVDLEQGEIGGGVGADEGRLDGLTVREADLDRLGAVDHVEVGHDVTVLVDHEAGAESPSTG